MTFVPVAVFWAIAAVAFFGPPRRLVYLVFAMLPLGGFAVIPPQLTGGLTFTGAPIAAMLFIARMLCTAGGLRFAITGALSPSRMMLLFLLLVSAVVSTLFMPRFWAGRIEIVPFRGEIFSTSPLLPSPGNLSQLLYLAISILAVVAFAFFLRERHSRQDALRALCLGCAVAVATGVLDFAGQYLPLQPVLDVFRTASYALAVDVVVQGGKRVVGLMPEASVYGWLCMNLVVALYFLRRAIRDPRLRDVHAPVLIVLLIAMIWLAKSTTAYVGIAIAVILAGLEWISRSRWRRAQARTTGLKSEFWVAFCCIMGLVGIILVRPTLFDPMFTVLDQMVLNKASSSSFQDRGMWRETAWQAFLASPVFGIGLGSTRASSAVVSMLASVGLVGATCYFGFLLQTVFRRARPDDPEGRLIVNAFGWVILPGLIVGFFIGAADFGLLHAFLYGLVTAVGTRRMASPQIVLADPPAKLGRPGTLPS